VFVSLLFFFSSGKELCSIMISLFLLVPVGVPVLVSLFFLLWFQCLFPCFFLLPFLRKGVLFHHDLLVPARIPVFISLFFSDWGSGAYLSFFSSSFSQERDFIPSWISWFLLLRAGTPVLVPLLLFSFFLNRKMPNNSVNFKF
jgi:hypothetical protein